MSDHGAGTVTNRIAETPVSGTLTGTAGWPPRTTPELHSVRPVSPSSTEKRTAPSPHVMSSTPASAANSLHPRLRPMVTEDGARTVMPRAYDVPPTRTPLLRCQSQLEASGTTLGPLVAPIPA